MDINEILKRCDHTLLSQTATQDEIKNICNEGILYSTASVCIPPAYVKLAKEYVGDRLKICTVIGFPNGYEKTSVKIFETREAILDGADEIDMVINIGFIKDKKYEDVLHEINAVKKACGEKMLKVIIETCLLTEEEKIKMCEIVSSSSADYIKTSTGFGGGGATVDDIKLFKKYISNGKKIKAAGGISSIADAEGMINAGADRLGTSRIVKLARNDTGASGY